MMDEATYNRAVLNVPWYTVENNLVGGWSVTNVNLPTADLRHEHGHFTIADCWSEGVARHIVALHNTALGIPTA